MLSLKDQLALQWVVPLKLTLKTSSACIFRYKAKMASLVVSICYCAFIYVSSMCVLK